MEGPAAAISSASVDNEIRATLVADTHCILGECILFDEQTQSVWWTDIDGKALYRATPLSSDKNIQKIDLPKMVGAFCFTSVPNLLLLGWEDGFQLYDWVKQEAIGEYSSGEPVNPKGQPSRLNDGRCSGSAFVCGGFFGHLQDCTVKVYSVTIDDDSQKLKHVPIIDNVQITNSLAFGDGDKMYFCDSPTKQIHVYDYHDGGIPTSPRLLYSYPEEEVGFPDGSCVDADGYLWSCIWRSGTGPGRVQRLHPVTGGIDYIVHMPDTTSQVTCCCFGGPDLNILFISTASIERDATKEPNAGGIYAAKVPFQGRPERWFPLP
jgi:L-arabinonolactonase